MKRFTRSEQVNSVAARRRIAQQTIEQGSYIF